MHPNAFETDYLSPFFARLFHPYSVLGLLLLITTVRLWVIAASPLGPGVDEAQYWLWGQDLQLGYYSKPPLIAWLLGGINLLFGQSEFSLRASGPLLHLLTSLILWQAGSRIGGIMAGRYAAILWVSLPAVGLGSFVISTDSVMLPFWAAGLYFILAAHTARTGYLAYMAGAGIAIGLASLAKYAGLYFIPCLLIFLLIAATRSQPYIKGFFVFCLAVLMASSPTWLWNIFHEFITFYHLGENANLEKQSYSLASLFGFVGSQFGVAGPVTFLLVLILPFYRQMRTGLTGGLHAFFWPVLAVICVQAFLSEANANWAAASYPALVLLLAYGGSRLAGQLPARLILPATAINLVLTAILGAVLAIGSFGPLTPQSDPLRRLRGWQEMAQTADRLAEEFNATTLIAYSRASAALLHWHLAGKGYYIALPLAIKTGGRGNHYQRSYPLDDTIARPWLAIIEGDSLPAIAADWQAPIARLSTQISQKRSRHLSFWLAR